MALVPRQLEILEAKSKQVPSFRIDLHFRQRERFAAELCFHLFQVIPVNVHITKSVNEVTRLQAHDLCDHHGEQGIRGDVKRYAKENVGAALIHLAAKFAVNYVELEHRVARRQCLQAHRGIFLRTARFIRQQGRVPGRNDVAA